MNKLKSDCTNNNTKSIIITEYQMQFFFGDSVL